MHANRSYPSAVACLLTLLLAFPLPAFAEEIGWPYRGPSELSGGSDEGDDSADPENPDDPNANPDDPNANPDDPGGAGGSGDATSPGGAKGPGGKAASIDGNILWSWWWEHNKDRYLARATERGRVNAGSIDYWFGAGAKYPPRDIKPVSEAQRRRIYESLVKRLADKSAGVRSAACIALGRLREIPANDKDKEASAKDEALTNNMCARALLDKIRNTTDADVRGAALLGLGMTGDVKGSQALLRIYDKSIPVESKGYALIAFGLARCTDAIPLVVDSLPNGAGTKAETEVAAIHALGLYGPALVEEIQKYKAADGGRDGIDQLESIAVKSSRTDVLPVQAVTSLGRLGVGLAAVKKASVSKSLSVKWAAILAMANYSGSEDDARDAAKQLTIKAYKGDQQTKNFCILAAGDLAGRLSPNSDARADILKWLTGKKQLDSNDNYTRACSALALGVANDRTAVPAIAELLESTTIDHYVAGACSVALGLLKAADQADLVLTRAVKGKFNNDAKGYGLVGLALMGDTTRIDEITALTKGTTQREIDRQSPLALGVLGDRRHARMLTTYFQTKFKTQRQVPVSNAVFGLAWIRDSDSVDTLVSMADTSDDAEVRGMATIALGYVGSPVSVSELTRCFVSTTYRKRFAGWVTLYRISGIL